MLVPVVVAAVSAGGAFYIARVQARQDVTNQVVQKLLEDSLSADQVPQLKAIVTMLIIELHRTRESLKRLGEDPGPLPPILLQYIGEHLTEQGDETTSFD